MADLKAAQVMTQPSCNGTQKWPTYKQCTYYSLGSTKIQGQLH